jgi:hypothetical protein
MNQLLEKKSTSRKSSLDKKYTIQFLPECLFEISKIRHLYHKDRKLKTSYVIDLVHNLILKYYFRKENSYNLSSLILKDKYGYLYNYYINYLVENDILKLVRNHSKGVNSRIYKLNEIILKNSITRYKNTDKVILKKIKKVYLESQNKETNSNNILSDVKIRLVEDLHHVEIDYPKSIFFLDSSKQEVDIYQKNRYSVEAIKDKNIFYHFDNYGRLHTNFTILKSFIRKNCLLIDGEETCEIDIKNSQPLFLSKIISREGKEIIKKDELELYNYLTKNGIFYQYLQEKFQIKDKKLLKEMIYKVFFGKNYPNKLDKSFQKIFPSIYQFIKDYKKIKGDYRYLSYELQKLESDFIFNNVVKKVYNTSEEFIVITCHDSIICKKKDVNMINSIFDDSLKKEFDDTLHNDCVFNI